MGGKIMTWWKQEELDRLTFEVFSAITGQTVLWTQNERVALCLLSMYPSLDYEESITE